MKPIPATEKRSRKAKLTIVEQRHATDGKPTKTAQLAQAGRLKLTDDLERKICDLIEHGAPYESACQECGIARRTLYNWRTAGTAKPDGRYGRFLAAIKNAVRKKKRADVAEAERRIYARYLRRFKTL